MVFQLHPAALLTLMCDVNCLSITDAKIQTFFITQTKIIHYEQKSSPFAVKKAMLIIYARVYNARDSQPC